MKSLVSIDLGFSFCKAIINGKAYIIKSVVGDSKQLRFEDLRMSRSEGDHIITDMRGRKYFVSDLAVTQSKVQQHSLKANRFDSTATKVLLHTLFGMGLGSGEFEGYAVSGLPVSHYTEFKDDIRKLFQGTPVNGKTSSSIMKHSYSVYANGEDLQGDFTCLDSRYIPQPFGALLDVMLDDNGNWKRKELGNKMVAVIDIGFGTSDIYVTDSLEASDGMSFSSPVAMNTVYALIAQEIEERGGGDFSLALHRIEENVRKGSISIRGKEFDLKPVIKYAHETVAAQLIGEIHNKWNNEEWRIDNVFIAGGGGRALHKYIEPEFANTELIEDSQWAVVRGYNKWGKRTWHDLGEDSNAGKVLVSDNEEN
ncbi:hypothetical protein QB910_000128 [Dabrowskivirus KKP3916]|uniref:Actin-like protein N-terminal domain-containing protein n=1 Tax=Alicyclobacillus phage KKP_3916 TaxID=3040651 RepID=A0AAT9V8U7_9CAUD|nr:hypothetical protein QB910_000128 [Alicyclobacillus phage KKP 3916]